MKLVKISCLGPKCMGGMVGGVGRVACWPGPERSDRCGSLERLLKRGSVRMKRLSTEDYHQLRERRKT